MLGDAVERVTGGTPRFGLGLGCTDARLWRYRGVPAVCWGPTPHSMGGVDEYLEVQDLLDTAAVHTLTALEFLS